MVDTAFIEALSSGAPTPGGGGASAYVGALAAALDSMVVNLTLGKKKYAHVQERMAIEGEELYASRARLLALVDEDAEAFEPLARSWRMAADTDEERAAKQKAVQQALSGACEVPLRIMEEIAAVLASCDFLVKCGNASALSDVGVAAAFAKAALQGASLNVFINVGSMDDRTLAAEYRDRTLDLVSAGTVQADGILNAVFAAIDAPVQSDGTVLTDE